MPATQRFRLKKNAPEFEVVDGKLAGRKFKRGVEYSEIPENEKGKFEAVKPAPKQEKTTTS